MKALWNNLVVASSDATRVVEGNHYFPADSLRSEFFKASSHTTNCPWKGTARYYSIDVDGTSTENAAWYYPEAKAEAGHIAGYVAFGKSVTVTASED
ncbi:DUF427 domain-containing protein [Reinekea sp.]|jgi:uncharacterized protein (DUF427 family)|uniref:DUF427 domain-containing protein n=1 Tax=Reinekea sp. TaxID=1970455 RepID=UPI002A7F5B8F|nr:DUF427 domain-containing protein [Reinekea sp.]